MVLITGYFCGSLLASAFIYEMVIAGLGKYKALISPVAWEVLSRYPVIGLAIGILLGHFTAMRGESNKPFVAVLVGVIIG